MRHIGHRNRVAFNAKLRHKLMVRRMGPHIRAAFFEPVPSGALLALFERHSRWGGGSGVYVL